MEEATVGLARPDAEGRTEGEEAEEQRPRGSAHVDQDVVTCLAHDVEDTPDVSPWVRIVRIGKRDHAIDVRMTLKKGSDGLVEYEIHTYIGEGALQGAARGNRPDGVAHPAEADHERAERPVTLLSCHTARG